MVGLQNLFSGSSRSRFVALRHQSCLRSEEPCVALEQNQNSGTLLVCPGVLEPDQKGTTPKHGHKLQAALQHWSSGEALE